MNLNETIPAEAGQTCDCCGRTHRKLYPKLNRMVGESCLKNIEMAARWGVPMLAKYSQKAAERAARFLCAKMDAPGRFTFSC